MAEPRPKFYLTTPIYYVNARPHLGHTYTTIVADVIARYKRMCGFDVVLLTGTDEHGQKVARSAKAAGVPEQQFVDLIAQEYLRLWQELGLQIDRFVRTTELRHARAVQQLFRKAADHGDIYKGHYEGQYCVFDELYVDDPTPGAPCPDCGRPTERIREENYFFKLSAFQDRLLEHYDQHPEFVQPETRRNEVIAFVRGGLRDLSISRTTLKWGIPWPGDEQHVFYVWSDALVSYMTGVGYGDDPKQYERLWPADLHLVGKEILRFHAVYWPAFLMASGEPLPKTVFAHGLWNFLGEKMSKSRGNIQFPQPIARVLGVDALRYFLLREMVFGQDGNFSRESLITRYISDLADGLGNLTSRTLTMVERYFRSEIPKPPAQGEQAAERTLAFICRQAISLALEAYEGYRFSDVLQHTWTLISNVDSYLTTEKPWKLAEDENKRDHLAEVLYTAAETLRVIAVLGHPVLPHATQKIWQQMGLGGAVTNQRIDQVRWGDLKSGTKIGRVEPIFPRVDVNEVLERIENMEQEMRQPPSVQPAAAASSTTSGRITIEDFAKVDMRVGEVKSAERVAGADKLLKLMVDVGGEVRQLVAGVAEVYKPEDLLGRKVIVVVNLQPRKLRGVESNGMIVAASVGPEGKPVLAGFLEDVPAGARLK